MTTAYRARDKKRDRRTEEEGETSIGGVEADKLIDALKADALPLDCAWLRYVELTSRYGKSSPAARAFILTLAKRASSGPLVE